MAKTAKKSAKKAVKKVKKVNPGFERAVKTAMWGTVGFAILTMFWGIFAYGVQVPTLIMYVVFAALGFLIWWGYKKENHGLVGALSGGMAALMTYAVVAEVFAGKLVFSGDNIVGTAMTVMELILMLLLLGLTLTHFVWIGTKSQKAIKINRKLNFFVLLASVVAMVLCGAVYGFEEPVLLVAGICSLGFLIFATDLVQRLEERK
ncbi:hypothetical protein IJF86_02360 [Candidatus Saccharibacteria bacterium]|nr:hypothetical protein [Candidatus Saccharibacteria bacterium]